MSNHFPPFPFHSSLPLTQEQRIFFNMNLPSSWLISSSCSWPSPPTLLPCPRCHTEVMNARSLVTSAILAPPATPKACCLVGDKYGDSEQPAKEEEGDQDGVKSWRRRKAPSKIPILEMELKGLVVVLQTDIRKQYLCLRDSVYEDLAHDRVSGFEEMQTVLHRWSLLVKYW